MMNKSISAKITSFDTPRQVKFYDVGGDEFIAGIGYQDFIICGCCGSIFNLEDLYDDYEASDNVPEQPIHIYDTWVGLIDAIVGE